MNFYIEIGISASISHHILKLKGPDPLYQDIYRTINPPGA
jgi:hypothetical protein